MKIKEFINKMLKRKENKISNTKQEESIQKQLSQPETKVGFDRFQEIEKLYQQLSPSNQNSPQTADTAYSLDMQYGLTVFNIEPSVPKPVQTEIERLEKIMKHTKNSRIKKKLAKRIEQLKTKGE